MDIRPIDAKDLSLIIRKHIPALGYGVRDSFLRKAVDKTTVECLHFTLDKIDKAPTLSLNTLRDAIYQDAVAHGLWEPGVLLLKQVKGDEKMASLALGVSLILGEAQEFVEAIDDPKKMEEELADIAIMCFSFAGRMGIDIDAAIRRKMEINKKREWKHGKSNE